MTTQCA